MRGAWTGAADSSPFPRLEAAWSSDLCVVFPRLHRLHHLDQQKAVQGGRTFAIVRKVTVAADTQSHAQHRVELCILRVKDSFLSASIQEGACYKQRGVRQEGTRSVVEPGQAGQEQTVSYRVTQQFSYQSC